MAKLWWNFRTSIGNLWGIYMGNKYCKKLHPIFGNSIGAPYVWKGMIIQVSSMIIKPELGLFIVLKQRIHKKMMWKSKPSLIIIHGREEN